MVVLRLLSPAEPDPAGALIHESERRRIEEALRASDRKFSLAFHASPGGFAITTFEDGRYIDANAAECRMTGYRREELIGRSIFELGIWADPEDGRRLRALLVEQGVIENFEYRFRRKDGEIRTGLLMSALIDIDGERCIISESIDLTDLKRAEETLKLSEERLRMATEGAELALWDWDLTTGRVFCNDLYFRLLGYEPGEFEVTYETWAALVHPDDRQEAEARTRVALLEGLESYSSEYRIRRKDGTYRWVHDQGRAVQHDAAGRPTRALGIHVDITRRKETEAALRRTHDELEHHVQVRTRELVKSNRSLKQQVERRRRVEKELRAKEKQLERRTQDLLEVNAALKVLLRQREEDRREIEEQVSTQLKNLVLPYLEKLKKGKRSTRESNYLGIIEGHLRGLAAPATAGVTDKLCRLTPAEIQVANFIKGDKGSKEIAALLGVTVKTVEFHRYSIRRKMGLLNRRVNLRSFLKTLK
jgi:PAS domain S-box-containing protein